MKKNADIADQIMFDLSPYAKGFYLLEVRNESGMHKTYKIVKN